VGLLLMALVTEVRVIERAPWDKTLNEIIQIANIQNEKIGLREHSPGSSGKVR